MLHLPTVTLLCVDTRYPELALEAMRRCLAQVRFAHSILITDEGWRPRTPAPVELAGVRGINSVRDYSAFLVKRLGDYVKTDHVLVIQWDGYILHPECWDDAFLDYDYIGAPWPGRGHYAVGNGGFSLRSRHLLDALADKMIVPSHPEDACICEVYRDTLERTYGIRFAPTELAARFSFELQPQPKTFGFHGFFNFHRAMPEDELLDYLTRFPTRLLFSLPARRLAKNAMREGAFEVARHIVRRRMEGDLKQRLDALKLLARLAYLRYRRSRQGAVT